MMTIAELVDSPIVLRAVERGITAGDAAFLARRHARLKGYSFAQAMSMGKQAGRVWSRRRNV